MSTQAVKAEIINNVMVAMSYYIQQQTVLMMLEQVMQRELVRVNMEEITTLPAERKDSIAERNKISPQYLEQVFASLRKAGIVKSIKRLSGRLFLKPSATGDYCFFYYKSFGR